MKNTKPFSENYLSKEIIVKKIIKKENYNFETIFLKSDCRLDELWWEIKDELKIKFESINQENSNYSFTNSSGTNSNRTTSNLETLDSVASNHHITPNLDTLNYLASVYTNQDTLTQNSLSDKSILEIKNFLSTKFNITEDNLNTYNPFIYSDSDCDSDYDSIESKKSESFIIFGFCSNEELLNSVSQLNKDNCENWKEIIKFDFFIKVFTAKDSFGGISYFDSNNYKIVIPDYSTIFTFKEV